MVRSPDPAIRTRPTDLHFFADALRDRHRGNTTRLSATYNTMLTVAIFVEKLGKLRGLPRPGFPNHDDNWTVKV